MLHQRWCIGAVAFLVLTGLLNEAAAGSLTRPKRDSVTEGFEVELSASGEDPRASIPVISDIQRVEKIADLLISIGEHVIPALLDGLAEQVTAATPERKLLRHFDKGATRDKKL